MVKIICWHETKLRTEKKNDFEKDFFKLMNSSVFGKSIENVRKHRDIMLVTTDKIRNQLVSEPDYYTTKWLSDGMNKTVHLGLLMLEISNIYCESQYYVLTQIYVTVICQ